MRINFETTPTEYKAILRDVKASGMTIKNFFLAAYRDRLARIREAKGIERHPDDALLALGLTPDEVSDLRGLSEEELFEGPLARYWETIYTFARAGRIPISLIRANPPRLSEAAVAHFLETATAEERKLLHHALTGKKAHRTPGPHGQLSVRAGKPKHGAFGAGDGAA